MDVEFSVCNPSDYARAGHMTWDGIPTDFQLNPDRIALFLAADARTEHCPLPAQLDVVGPPGQREHVLAFTLPEAAAVAPGESLPLVLKQKQSPFRTERYIPAPAAVRPPLVELYNDRLFVSLSLAPSHCPDDPACFAGAAQSVRLCDLEFLEPFALDLSAHDPEKRCMQIDRVRAWRRASDSPEEHSVFDRPWDLVAESTGPVRTVVTIAQRLGSDAGPFHLCRTLSLFAGEDYLVDQLSVGPDDSGITSFALRYFANMDMSAWPERFQHAPGWLSISFPYGGRQPGYGFASSAPVDRLENPHPGYPDGVSRRERTFSWELAPQERTCCLHAFLHGGDVRDRTGRLWHERIQAPLFVRAATRSHGAA